MSQENVDVVRRVWDAWSPTASSTPFLSSFDPEIVHDPSGACQTRDVYRGHEGLARLLLGVWRKMGDVRLEPQRVHRSPGKIGNSAGCLAGGGSEQWRRATAYTFVCKVRDVKVIDVTTFQTRSEVLEPAGLSE